MVTGDSQGPRDPANPPDPLIGRTLNGRFTILEPIGIGGMGRVYRATQAPLDRVVALKVLSPNFPTTRDPGFQKRFLREASLSSKLRHPNTVTVIDYGQTEDGIYYIAMEYLEGRTLAQILGESGSLSWTRALAVAQQVCRSLREAHGQGIIHRDLKPANIMLLNEADQDLVKVLDFGLVKSIAEPDEGQLNPEITQSGTFLGSPAYMAPEQARNTADARSDVYSLGVMLYQMLAGRPPFISRDHLELIFSHHKETPPTFNSLRPPVFVPPDIEAVVRRCLEKDPAQRYQSMDELLEAMRGASMAAGGHSGIFKRPGVHHTTGPHPTPSFISTPGNESASGNNDTLAVDISVEVPESMRKARRRMLLMGGLGGGGIAVVLAGAMLLLARGYFTRTGATAETPSPSVTAPSQPAGAAAADSRRVRFRLMSQPEGARVFYKGEDRGVTPLSLEVPKPEGENTLTAEFTFVLDGYQTETVITGGSGDVVFSQKLQPRRGTSTRNGGSGAARTESSTEGKNAAPSLGSMSAPVLLGPEAAPPPAEPAAAEPESPGPVPGGLVVAVPALTQGLTLPASAGGPVPFQEGMARPVELKGKDIVYTREALEAKVQGTMVVKCIITKAGSVENCRIIKGLPYMNEAVVSALKERQYKPIMLRGEPVDVDYVFNLRLVLPRGRR
jgi:serine/threonine-protein kinase